MRGRNSIAQVCLCKSEFHDCPPDLIRGHAAVRHGWGGLEISSFSFRSGKRGKRYVSLPCTTDTGVSSGWPRAD